ncbi:MAG: hypothetical protein K2X10_13040 [Hyphomicrobiales bacterium]|nr:hypothetical protein [Hyphomicrobiales bacterium]
MGDEGGDAIIPNKLTSSAKPNCASTQIVPADCKDRLHADKSVECRIFATI